MAGEQTWVQVPPDSTGKKIRHNPYLRVNFTGNTGGHVWEEGGTYTITGSTTLTVTVFKGLNGETGNVGIKLKQSDIINNAPLPIQGDIISYEGQQVATIGANVDMIYIPYGAIVGGSKPDNTVEVDNTGSMNVRFSEGLPQLDAFGSLRVSSGTSLGDYTFTYNRSPADFSTKIIGNASLEHDSNLRAIKLINPAGVPAAGSFDPNAGLDKVAHVSNTYHHYFPGFSQVAMMTVALGDTGRDGVDREWGYFDRFNGYFFRCDDSTNGLKCVVRTSTSGTVTETVITSADFNGDPVDGTGDSQMNLHLTNDNIYWIDVQWLGAGRVRFGTYHRGERIVIHEYYHEGELNNGKPHTQTASLPIKFAQTTTQTQISESVMLAWCASVHTEHAVDVSALGKNRLETMTKTFDPTNIENNSEYELIGVLSPVKSIPAGTLSADKSNRSVYLPNYMEALAYHADGSEAFVELEVYADSIIGGGTKSFPINQDQITDGATAWMVPVTPLEDNGIEVFKPASYTFADRPKFWGGGIHVHAQYMKGYARVDISNVYTNLQDGSFKNYAEQGGSTIHPVDSITPSPDGTTPTVVTMATGMRHREGYPVAFKGIEGTLGTDATNGLNITAARENRYYLRITAVNQAELYHDIEFKNPVITQGLTATNFGMMGGDYGDQMYFVAVCKPLPPTIAKQATAGDVTIHFNLGWSEIQQ